METFFHDLRFSFRMLVKNPGFTAVALIALALGIGANTALFSVINAALLRPLPYPEPERLVSLWETDLQKTESSSVAPANFFDWKEQNQVFEDMAAFTSWAPSLTGTDQPERINGVLATANLFSTFGVEAAVGRTFSSEEGELGQHRVAVLSHRLWQRRFASDPHIIGQAITLNGQSFTVIGVMKEDFRFPLPNMMRGSSELMAMGADLWAPLAFDRSKLQRNNHSLAIVARLKPGITRQQAQSDIESVGSRLAELYPKSNEGLTGKLVSLSEEVTLRIRTALLVLFGAVGFVLLIACANVANLLLARAASRQKEMAIRLAVGASRARIVRQLLAESLLLAVVGGIVGSLLGLWAIDILLSITPADIHFSRQPGIDAQVLGFTVVLSLLTGLIFGLAPALEASKPDLTGSLKEGGKGSTAGRARARSAFVIAEVAIAVILLVGAGIMLRSFLRLQNIDPGFDPENVLTMQLSLPSSKYPTQQQRAAFFHQVLDRSRAIAGVESVGLVSHLPLSGDDAAF
ncbi:MAG TPA: ABC transporter permease, partial [Blastocatellia bacterium]